MKPTIPLLALAAAALTSAAAFAQSMPPHNAIVVNRAPLQPTPFVRLPMGSVHPEGWLQRQLELQRDGLTGHAEELYDALQPNSGWLGGDGDGWEKSPYYVKGLVALAHTLDDDGLKAKAEKWVDWVLESQDETGWFGPESNEDWWPRMVVLYYLRDHYEATGDERVMPFLLGYFRHQLAALPERPLSDWGKARAGDNLDVVLWTYHRTGEPFLLELAEVLRSQAYPWTQIFANDEFYGRFEEFHPHHIVNVSQAFKFPPVAWQLTGDDADRNAFAAGVEHLEAKYGRVDGQISGTEMLSNQSSTAGVELCADVERILSNGIAVTILGDAALADQMEKVAYNSLPAHTTPEMTGITYYQLLNQVACTNGGHGFEQDYANANLPGPFSGFPCCCYNWHFGWPKLVQHLWAGTADGGVAAIAYGPSRVDTTVSSGVAVEVVQETDYPFGDTVTLHVNPAEAATFPVVVRVPGWCEDATATVNGEPVDGMKAGTFVRIDREWQPGDTVHLTFPMKVRTSTWINGSVGVERGPLTFGLDIAERWIKVADHDGPFDEYEVLPDSAWNVALASADPRAFEVETRPVGEVPFAKDAAPVVLITKARRLPSWGMRSPEGRVILGRSDGAWQPLIDGRLPLASGESHHLKVEVDGDRLRVWVDDMDRPVLDQRDATHAGPSVGLRAYQTTARFQNVTLDGEAVTHLDATFGGWSTLEGTFEVATDASAKAILRDDVQADAFTFEADVTVAEGGDAGLMIRASHVGEGLDAFHGYYVGLATRGGQDEDAQEPPTSPATSAEPLETVRLVPFGSSKLRVSYLPVLGGD